MKKSFNKFFDLLKSILVILIVLGFLSMIFGFMADIFSEADVTPDISIGENEGNGSGGSGGSGGNGSGGSGGSSDNDEPGENENPGGSGEGEAPDKPSEPDVPINPDEPYDPDVPTDPDEPYDPSEPVEPDEPDEPACTHRWGEWIILSESTCIEKGARSRTCELCDKRQDQTMALAPHTYGDDNVCDVCGYERCEHEVEEWFVEQEPTCYLDGISYGYCIHCRELIYKYPECKDHSFNSDDICEDCHYRKPSDEYENDMEDNSSIESGVTEDDVNYRVYDIDMGYVNNGNSVYLDICTVYNMGYHVPIEFVISSYIVRRVRIEVYFSHPVGESAVLTRYSDGVTISPIEYGDYGAVFEFDYDYYDCYIFDLFFSTAEYPDAHVQELYIYCYEG